MKPAPFEYLSPDSLEAALAALEEYGYEAKLLAGGQSLVPAMNFRLLQPGVLIDLNRVSELKYIRETAAGGLAIGAMTRQSQLETDPLVAERAPLLHETIPFIAHQQIRNRGTIGGSLAHADPAAELPVIALALGARFKIERSGETRWIPSEEFFYGMFTTDLSPDEVLVEIELPPMPHRTGWSFMEVARRTGDYAMMGIAALVSLDERGVCDQARLVYLNAGDGPVEAKEAGRSLLETMLSEADFTRAAALASEQEIDPQGNVHASIDYQRHLARVLTVRALDRAAGRARRGIAGLSSRG